MLPRVVDLRSDSCDAENGEFSLVAGIVEVVLNFFYIKCFDLLHQLSEINCFQFGAAVVEKWFERRPYYQEVLSLNPTCARVFTLLSIKDPSRPKMCSFVVKAQNRKKNNFI